MYLDRELEFSDSQVVTVTAASTDLIDLQDADRQVGEGEPIYLVIQVDVTATAAGAATVDFQLETDDAVGFPSATILFSTGATAIAGLTAGTTVAVVAVPHNSEQFLRLRYVVATGPLTAGSFSAFLTKDAQSWRAYADALAPV